MENNRCYGCMEEKQNHPICEHCGFDERQQNLPHQLATGTILRGQYLIGRVLGQGGFGITYLAWDLYLQAPVAIKEYYPSSCVTRDAAVTSQVTCYTGPESRTYETNKERFLREGRALAKFQELQHIVKTYGLFPENNTVYLVMEYIKGITLQNRLKQQGPMPLPRILELLEPVMEDLQKVHEEGIIHRDISPDNIMLTEDGRAKLLDFGAVRQVENPDQEAQLSKSTETILKQGFAPLEQYNSRGSLGPWTDVYALCATICYCLNGKLPQMAPDRALEEDSEHFIDILPIMEKQKKVIRRGMAVRPRERTASVSQLLTQLRTSLKEEKITHRTETRQAQPLTPPKQEEPPKPPKPPRQEKSGTQAGQREKTGKKPAWLIPAGIGLAVLVILGALALRPDPAAHPGEAQRPAVWFPAAADEAPVAIDEDLVLKNFDPEGKSAYAFGTDIPKESVVSIELLDSLEGAPEDAVDVSATGKGRVLLWGETDDSGNTRLYIAGDGTVTAPEDCRYLFGGEWDFEKGNFYRNLKTIDFSLGFNTAQATNMAGLFAYGQSLEQLDLRGFRTGRVISMESMFDGCSSLTHVDLEGLDTGAVTNMHAMFYGCQSLGQLDLSSFSTDYVNSMDWMFYDCKSLEQLDLSHFRTERVMSMAGMFRNCSGMRSLDLSGMDTGNVSNTDYMFAGHDAGLKLLTDNQRLQEQLAKDPMVQIIPRSAPVDAEGLTVQAVSSRTLTVRVDGLQLQNLYTVNQDSTGQYYMEYSWEVKMLSPQGDYAVSTSYCAEEPGKNNRISLGAMQHSVWMYDEYACTTIQEARASWTDDSITWTFSIPEEYPFALEDVTEYVVIVRSIPENTEIQRTYVVERPQ